MELVTLIFTYTQGEYVKATRKYLIANKTIRRIDPLIAAVTLLASIYYLYRSEASVLGIVGVTVVLFAVAFLSYVYFFLPMLTFKSASKYHEEYTLTFSNEHIKFKTPSLESVLQWEIYSSLWESDDFYFMIQAPRIYTLIPKRVFANPVDKQAFENLAAANIKCLKHI